MTAANRNLEGETMQTERFRTNYGDVLEVRHDGTMWVAPVCGSQHPLRRDAMLAELDAYLRASGEDVDADDLDLADHGTWEDDQTIADDDDAEMHDQLCD